MAKSSTVAAIRAKPNQRGKRSHLPLYCSVKGCDEDFYVSVDSKRACKTHHDSPVITQKILKLRSLGLIP